MMLRDDTSKPLLSFFLGLVAFGIILLALMQLPTIAKTLGTPFMLWPEFLGVTQRVRSDEVVRATIAANTFESSAEIPQSGRFLLYTDNYHYLNNSVKNGSIAWIKLFSADSNARVPMLPVSRGLRPYDTPLAAGRPIMRIQASRSGFVNIEHPNLEEPVTIYIVPDYLSGNEGLLSILFAAQLALIIGIPLAIRHNSLRRAQQERLASSMGRQAKVDAFFENERKKRSTS